MGDNLKWLILDQIACENSFSENQNNCEKFGFLINKNKT